VPGAAVEDHLPVGARRAHLLLERQALLRGHHRVLAADADQYLPGDVARVCGIVVGRAGVEPDHGLEVGVVSGQFEHHHRTEAVADRRGLRGVHARLGGENLERGPGDGPHHGRVGFQVLQPGHHLGVGGGPGAAVVVHGERHVAETGELAGPVQFVVAESVRLVGDQDGRPLPLPVGKEKPASEFRAIGGVRHFAVLRHCPNV
jgi:hypothetical protein